MKSEESNTMLSEGLKIYLEHAVYSALQRGTQHNT